MQRDFLGDRVSDWAPVRSRVPQGSMIGSMKIKPLLFITYVNDLIQPIWTYIISSDLKRTEQVYLTVSKSNRSIDILKNEFTNLDVSLFKCLYKTLT